MLMARFIRTSTGRAEQLPHKSSTTIWLTLLGTRPSKKSFAIASAFNGVAVVVLEDAVDGVE